MEKITQGHPMTQSPDFVKENIETLKSLFPTIVKEGKIDWSELQALLGNEIETEDEYYRLTWAGKSMARKEANKPSTATLRPNKADSKDWDTTQNIFIEGDNLEVLKLLQKSYANKIKMIYIDPPYNTGNDFVYKDNYADNLSNYLALTGQLDNEGKRKSSNTESDGRYHSNWLNMIYPRLKIAQNLLMDDGLIFISIDDNEVHNLRKVCDEIFGEVNFVSEIIWKKSYGGGSKSKYIVGLHEYILMYAKNKSSIEDIVLPPSDDVLKYYKWEDENFPLRGPYRKQPLSTNSMDDRPNLRYPIFWMNEEIMPEKQWQWSQERVKNALEKNELVISNKNGKWTVEYKQYLKDENGETRGAKLFSILEGPYTQIGTNEIADLFGIGKTFTFPKPSILFHKLISITNKDAIILDFFSGSSSLAHAVMQLNADEGGSRKFILVQLPEHTDENSDAYKAGFKNIADIGKERIRRAGEKIKSAIKPDLFSANNKPLDIGFKAFKLDSSNMNAWDGNPDKLETNLFNAGNNIKENRTEEDVLFEILLKSGLDLAQPIEKKVFAGKTVFNVGVGTLFICLAEGVTTEVAEGIGQWKKELDPATCKVIFKDNGFTDVEKTNSMQILKRFGIEEVNTI